MFVHASFWHIFANMLTLYFFGRYVYMLVGEEKFLVFSPDSQRVAYQAKDGDRLFVVVDGIEGRQYDDMLEGGEIIFDSPDSLHYLAVRDNSVYLVRERMR